MGTKGNRRFDVAKKKGEVLPKFGAAVQAAREKAGLSRHDVAKACGCGNSAVANIERGERCPSLALAARIAAEVGLRARLADYAEKIPG